jgi:hypothetical protein
MKHLLTAVLAALSLVTLAQAAPLNLPFNTVSKIGQVLTFLNRTEVRSVLRLIGMERYLTSIRGINTASRQVKQPVSVPVRQPYSAPVTQPVLAPIRQPAAVPVRNPEAIQPAPVADNPDASQRQNPPKRYGRHDNGKHLGWTIGKHKGWDRKSDDLAAGTGTDAGNGQPVADSKPGRQKR